MEDQPELDLAPASPPDQPALPEPPPALDADAVAAARTRVEADGRYGRLTDVVVWAAGVQGRGEPTAFAQPVTLVVGDDPQDPPAVAVATGGADAGADAVDRAVDGGADLLLLGTAPATVLAAAVVSRLSGREPVVCVRRGTPTWAADVAAVRDLRRTLPADPLAGSGVVATAAGLLRQASRRRTPVLLAGLPACAAALAAEAAAPDASLWWLLACSTAEPAAEQAARALELDPLLDLQLGFADAATLALPVLQQALSGWTA